MIWSDILTLLLVLTEIEIKKIQKKIGGAIRCTGLNVKPDNGT